MYRLNDSLYISGLVNMASFNMGPSYVDSACMDLDDYVASFSNEYNINSKLIELEEVNITLDKLIKDIMFLDRKAVDTLVHWLSMLCGKCTKIYTANNSELFDKLSKNGPFFFLEDLYFIEFEKMAVCFLIGNDE